MASLINRVPPGLLSLLDIKASGQNPTILPDTLVPQLDVTDLYLNGFGEQASVLTAAITANGFWGVTAFDAGPGELIVLTSCVAYVDANLGAGTSLTYALVIADNTGVSAPYALIAPEVTGTVGGRPMTGSTRNWIIPPGYRIGAYATQGPYAVAPQVRIGGRFVRLKV